MIVRQAPVIANVPADITAECDAIPAEPTNITATDNCDENVEVIFEEVRTNGDCQDNFTLTRTWTATDDCENVATETQVITIIDSTNPVLSNVPSDITAECDAVPAQPTDVTATDNCDEQVEIEFSEERTNGDCEDSFTLTRTWTATDNCGNAATGQQVITIIDSTDPVLANVPADVTAECDAVPAQPTDVTATDNCDEDVTIEFNVVRTWAATDNCGNVATGQQVITIIDSTDPVLANVPADVTAECDAIPAEPTDVTATDNCDEQVEVEFSSQNMGSNG